MSDKTWPMIAFPGSFSWMPTPRTSGQRSSKRPGGLGMWGKSGRKRLTKVAKRMPSVRRRLGAP